MADNPPSSDPDYLNTLDNDICVHRTSVGTLAAVSGVLAVSALSAVSARRDLLAAFLGSAAAAAASRALGMYSSGAVLRGLRAFAGDHAGGRAYFARHLAEVLGVQTDQLGVVRRAINSVDLHSINGNGNGNGANGHGHG